MTTTSTERISLNLDFAAIRGAESVHYYDSETHDRITQRGNTFSYRMGSRKGSFTVGLSPKLRIFEPTRLTRRLARVDKGACVPIAGSSRLFVFYQTRSYVFDMDTQRLDQTGNFVFRNPLHGGTAELEGRTYFGEYFPNPEGRAVHIYASDDECRSWDVAYTFDAGTIWHIHGVFRDPFEDGRLWACTGDYDGQCQLITTTDHFKTVERFGDGSQKWRAVSIIFTADALYWGMDSPLSSVHVMRFDRKTGELEQGQPLPGPVWFSKQFTDGGAILQTSVEHSEGNPGVTSRSAKLYASKDLDNWTEVDSFPKDRYPHRYFRHGVLHFSDGAQTSQDFTIHGDALVGFDGKVARASLTTPGH